MSNFALIPDDFGDGGLRKACQKAELYIHSDPRSACFQARFALESLVHWLYQHDRKLKLPYKATLGAMLHEPSFQQRMQQQVFEKAKLIQRLGNEAAHSSRAVRMVDAKQAVKELHHVCYWLLIRYAPIAGRQWKNWSDDKVPQLLDAGALQQQLEQAKKATKEELEQLQQRERELQEQNAKLLKAQQERERSNADLRKKLEAMRAEKEAQRAEAEEALAQQPNPHDYNEAQTRAFLIDVELRRAGWELTDKRDREYEVHTMPTSAGTGTGKGYVDYVLWGDDGLPLAVVEAKRTSTDAESGQQQAKLYADCLERETGQRPVMFYSNGYDVWLWDDARDSGYPPRQVGGFYSKAALETLMHRRKQRQPLDAGLVNAEIAGRHYQKQAIGEVFGHFAQYQRKALLVMATGTGKTRTAVALVDVMQRCQWAKRVLFLADRVSLVRQAVAAFKQHLPQSSPVNLVTEKDTEGRVYVCTYPTMMGLIDEQHEGEARFGVGYFDLIVVDEAHRSIYQRYQAIFDYFDAFLLGLTATPSEHVDRNTYRLFGLEDSVPTFAYELETAVEDGFLVPRSASVLTLQFPARGIRYDELSAAEQEEWDELEWEDAQTPNKVNAAAVNSWLFNASTVDLVLQHLMAYGHKVDGGDRLAKTIVFARNHDHAKFIEKRFNHHYPQYQGHFARVIDNYEQYAQTLIGDFSVKEKNPHIAISVDMLDTGIDVPEVANLVFFKPVYSRIKFWQMIGRGTRLCPDLFAPGVDKYDFRVFDCCDNFAFFNEKPEGNVTPVAPSVQAQLFAGRVQLLQKMQQTDGLSEAEQTLAAELADTLHGCVAAMSEQNFLVRKELRTVHTYQNKAAWEALTDDDVETTCKVLAGLPSGVPQDDEVVRRFDLQLVRMQLALLVGDVAALQEGKSRVEQLATLLLPKRAVPAVKKELAWLQDVANGVLWAGLTLDALENMRLRMRVLLPFAGKQNKVLLYTHFQDELLEVREEEVAWPRMAGEDYRAKVQAYLKQQLNHVAIQKLRCNKPLTEADLQSLENMLIDIGEVEAQGEGENLLKRTLEHEGAASLPAFVRSLVGMDRATAHAAFAEYLNDESLSAQQMRFVQLVVEQLTSRGVMQADALYEPPFSGLHAGGPDALFADRDRVIDGIFGSLAALHQEIGRKSAA